MNYEQFLQYIAGHIGDKIKDGEKCRIFIRRVNRNNGLYAESLHIYKKDSKISPAIELNSYYERYIDGDDLEAILEEIASIYEKNANSNISFVGSAKDYASVKNRIIMRLVNYERNKQVLESCPCIRFLDLAVTFRWLAYQDEIGVSTALITNRELYAWEKDCSQLFELAALNTPKFFPAKIRSIQEVLSEYIDLDAEKAKEPMYVLSNKMGIHGAVCMLYQSILKQFSDRLETDFYILPSSVHELILVPAIEYLTKENLYELVRQANNSVVSPEEVLSDSVYLYRRKQNQISIF